jgi:hypothetical protein
MVRSDSGRKLLRFVKRFLTAEGSNRGARL